MQSPTKSDQPGGAKDDAAREHSEYAEGDGSSRAEPRPRERGDHQDPGKRQTGPGNASKGPWKEQGGAGHGENYGARDEEPSSSSSGSRRGED